MGNKMKLAACVILLAVCVVAYPWHDPAYVSASDSGPKLTLEQKSKIMEIQLRQSQMVVQYNAIQKQLDDLKASYTLAQSQLDGAVEESFKQAKLSTEQWSLDLAKYEFVKKETPQKK